MNRKISIIVNLILALGAVAGFGAMFMLLWNAVVPQVFGFSAINFWQAISLLLLLAGLSKFMMISSFLGVRGYRHNPVREKWKKMTDKEREEFIRRRWHFGHGSRHFDNCSFCEDEESEENDKPDEGK
jgi:hypothetical protein